jgi:hypothetical protein
VPLPLSFHLYFISNRACALLKYAIASICTGDDARLRDGLTDVITEREFMGIFDLLTDVVKIAVAPIEIVANIAQVVTKPVVEIAEEIVDATKDLAD